MFVLMAVVFGMLAVNTAQDLFEYENNYGITYTAAVVEFRPVSYSEYNTGKEVLQRNAESIISFVKQAKSQNADIIVFPEYGLSGQNVSVEMDQFMELAQKIPDSEDKEIPCFRDNNSHTYTALKILSCTARNQQIYMVVDLIEFVEPTKNDSRFFFNTQVALDRSGQVVARYRKKHLFFEPYFEEGRDSSDKALFETDFGVLFSLQICFDILYEEPGLRNVLRYDVKDVAMSTFWIDELPFLTAPQIFSGWAYGLGVNLLASNYHIPEKGGMGSGIFHGVTKDSVNYLYSQEDTSCLIVSNVTTYRTLPHKNVDVFVSSKSVDHSSMCSQKLANVSTIHFIIHENLTNYTFLKLKDTGKLGTSMVCHNGTFCCETSYSLIQNAFLTEFQYYLVAFRGHVAKGAGKYQLHVEICAVILCSDNEEIRCTDLDAPELMQTGFELHTISGNFSTEYVYPSIFTTEFELIDWSKFLVVKERKTSNSVVLKNISIENNLLTASLFGRLYDQIPQSYQP